jgi:hypothetical protein
MIFLAEFRVSDSIAYRQFFYNFIPLVFLFVWANFMVEKGCK